jgi:hypothetical protein
MGPNDEELAPFYTPPDIDELADEDELEDEDEDCACRQD